MTPKRRQPVPQAASEATVDPAPSRKPQDPQQTSAKGHRERPLQFKARATRARAAPKMKLSAQRGAGEEADDVISVRSSSNEHVPAPASKSPAQTRRRKEPVAAVVLDSGDSVSDVSSVFSVELEDTVRHTGKRARTTETLPSRNNMRQLRIDAGVVGAVTREDRPVGELQPLRRSQGAKKATPKSAAQEKLSPSVVEAALVSQIKAALIATTMGMAKGRIVSTDNPRLSLTPLQPLESSKKTPVAFRLAFPCLMDFILHWCGVVAEYHRSQGPPSLSQSQRDENALRESLLMFGLFLEKSEETRGGKFSSLLSLACPSCRGLAMGDATLLYEIVLRSGLCTDTDALCEMPIKDVIELLGLPGGIPRSASTSRNCPCGAVHALLFCAAMKSEWGEFAVDAKVTFSAGSKWACYAKAARLLYSHQVARDQQIDTITRNEQRKYQRATDNWSASPLEPPIVPAPTQATLKTEKRALAGLDPNWVTKLRGAIYESRGQDGETLCDNTTSENAAWCARVGKTYAWMKRQGDTFFTLELLLPRDGPLVKQYKGAHPASIVRVDMEAILELLQTSEHMAAVPAARGAASGQTAAVPTSATATAWIEDHCNYVMKLRRAKDEAMRITVPGASGERREDAVALGGRDGGAGGDADGVNVYNAGTQAMYHELLYSVDGFTLGDIVDHAGRLTVGDIIVPACGQDALVPRELIHASLQRHQLESVQWMAERERVGFREFVEVPVRGSDGILHGALFYCAVMGKAVFLPPEDRETAWAYRTMRRVLRGGMLGDDVGLGKTLTLLTVCARDRAEQERDAAIAAAEDEEKEEEGVRGARSAEPATAEKSTVWEISGMNGGNAVSGEFCRWAFGFEGKLLQPPARVLPNTTLIVVPLSIAGQWIDEVQKFYPSARYVLYYGAKRSQYTVEDLSHADFVVTTYETLSMHLRREHDALARFLACRIEGELQDKGLVPRAKGGSGDPAKGSGGPRTDPEDVQRQSALAAAAQELAGTHVWRSGGGVGGCRRQLWVAVTALATAQGPPQAAAGLRWSVRTEGDTVTIEVPGGAVVEARTTSSDLRNANGATTSAGHVPSVEGVSEGFWDAVWDAFMEFASFNTFIPRDLAFFPTSVHGSESGVVSRVARMLYNGVALCSPDAATRKALVQLVLLPGIFTAFAKVGKALKLYYDDTVRLTDIHFRRVVLDEVQKCGSSALFHLLQSDRRWAVSGTPVSNNKISTMEGPLRFLGSHTSSFTVTMASDLASAVVYDVRRHQFYYEARVPVLTVCRIFDARRDVFYKPLVTRSDESTYCLCMRCVQRTMWGVNPFAAPEVTYALDPSKMQPWLMGGHDNRAFTLNSDALLVMLGQLMVRHASDEQIRNELALPPVEHREVRVLLTVDERYFYARAATAISAVALRLHRQGVVSGRMANVLVWIQDLCRLCLHPSLVKAELLGSGLEGRLDATINLWGDEGGPAEEVMVHMRQFLKSFVDVTVAEALEWARAERARATGGGLDEPRATKPFPEETLESLERLASETPAVPGCGVCLDGMTSPTVLTCYHMFCKECIVEIVENTRGGAGNARCPYCRDMRAMIEEKRVVQVSAGEEEGRLEIVSEEERTPSQLDVVDTEDGGGAEETVVERVARIGCGSRVQKVVELLRSIYGTDPTDGVLIFSKFPAVLGLLHSTLERHGYAPMTIQGSMSLAKRRHIISTLQRYTSAPGGSIAPAADAPMTKRMLLVTSRTANCGVNLTFANHIIFFESNINPAMETQAIGRLHRFGQTKPVTVYHLYSPGTIEQLIYTRTRRILDALAAEREQDPEQHVDAGGIGSDDAAANAQTMRRNAELGRVAPNEVVALLQYPVPSS